MPLDLNLGVHLGSITRGLLAGLEFTDDLTGSVAITTSIAARQCYQRGGSITLAGTYSVSGGTPSRMMARVGSGPWVSLSAASIGGGSWSGTLQYNAYAQGALEVKPLNGSSVTAGSVANITVSDIFVVNGQSNAAGKASSAQSYTKTNFDFTVFEEGAWSVRTTADWAAVADLGSCWPQFAELLDAAGIPPVLVRGHTASGSGFAGNDWNQGDGAFEAAEADMDAAAPGGFKAMLWYQGENDCVVGTTAGAHQAALSDFLDDMQTDVANFGGVPLFAFVPGEVTGASDANIEAVRSGVQAAADADADIRLGATHLHLDLTDDLHPTTTAQVEEIGKQWYRAVAAAFYGAADPGGPPEVLSATPGTGDDADTLSIVFDRAMQNHTDTTGWAVSDGGGSVTISSAAAATTTVADDTVVLTLGRDLYDAVTLGFGAGTSAVGATLKDTGTVVQLPPRFLTGFDAGTGDGEAPSFSDPGDLAGLQAWYDPAAPATLTKTGSRVTAFADLSPAERDLIEASGLGPIDAGGYLTFDGTQYLFRTDAFMYDLGDSSQVTISICAAITHANNDRVFSEGSSASGNPIYCPFHHSRFVSDRHSAYLRDDGGTNRMDSLSLDHDSFDGVKRVISVTDTGTTIQGFNNGVAGAVKAYTRGTSTFNRFCLGGLLRSTFASGVVMDFHGAVFYTDDQRPDVEGWLASENGVTLAA